MLFHKLKKARQKVDCHEKESQLWWMLGKEFVFEDLQLLSGYLSGDISLSHREIELREKVRHRKKKMIEKKQYNE